MREPGCVDELGPEGAEAWSAHVRRCLDQALARLGPSELLRLERGRRVRGSTVVDWTGLPTRVTRELGRARALKNLDAQRDLQEEYVEWRAVRERGRIVRVELTTELAAYWRFLAAYQPRRALELAAGFAGVDRAPPSALFGSFDPLAPSATPHERRRAFTAASAWNDGRRAICFMVQPTNTLEALLALAVVATRRRTVEDAAFGHDRCLTASEAIPLLEGCAQAGRASDPLLVERLGRLAFEERLVCFDDPIGVYLQGVEHARLRTPDGGAVPPDWFAFGRGVSPGHSGDGRARYQRLTVEVPEEAGFAVGELVDIATEQPIRHGGQIAELVQVAVVIGASQGAAG